MISFSSLTSWHIFCFYRQHLTESDCFIHEELTCLFIVCETIFTIDESQTISHANGTEQQTQEC